MSENLNVSRFQNGDVISEAKSADEWKTAGQKGIPVWCYYNNDPYNGRKYGKLYNWYAVNDKRGLAPEGWHIPTVIELRILAETADDDANALKAIGEGSEDGEGTNTSGFSALLAGVRNGEGGFRILSIRTFFYSSEEDYSKKFEDSYQVYTMVLMAPISYITNTSVPKAAGLSVRCLKN
jgi:uncharacterized protein (TIGR02145 family)